MSLVSGMKLIEIGKPYVVTRNCLKDQKAWRSSSGNTSGLNQCGIP